MSQNLNNERITMRKSLAEQKSLYLKQHAHQKIDWFVWCDEAFSKAKEKDCPLLISIGYSSCQWCDVMSRDCFDDSYVASLMNRHFVNVLVDREERPDLDQIYMEAVRMFSQSAGWPLNVFCLPDGKPFWGGTYFPKEDLGQGLAPWPQVLMRVSEHFRKDRSDLIENAKNVVGNLIHANDSFLSNQKTWHPSLLINCVHSVCLKHDDKEGGFTKAPKFPSPMKIDFLAAMTESESVRKNHSLKSRIHDCQRMTLEKIAMSSLFDHVNGGFFRYCTDSNWKNPHFEKMLQDNALLLSTFSKYHRKNPQFLFRRIVEKTIEWFFMEMGDCKKGFGASLSSKDKEIEGEAYLWDKETLRSILGEKDSKILLSFLVTQSDLFDEKYLPCFFTSEAIPAEKQFDWFEKLQHFNKNRLLTEVDPVRVMSSNSLVVKALVDASIAFNNEEWFLKAQELEKWIRSQFEFKEAEQESHPGAPILFLEDYCFWAEALLALSMVSELFQNDSSKIYESRAESVTEDAIKLFKDKKNPGYFISSSQVMPPAPCRKKFWFDNAIPSGNSVLLRVFSSLYHLTGKKKWAFELSRARHAYAQLSIDAPHDICNALTALTEDSIGMITFHTSPNHYPKIRDLLQNIPYRPIFFRQSKNEKTHTVSIKKTYRKEVSNPLQTLRDILI